MRVVAGASPTSRDSDGTRRSDGGLDIAPDPPGGNGSPVRLAPGGHYHLTWLRQPGTPADTLSATVDGRTAQAGPAQPRLALSADLSDRGLRRFLPFL